MCELEAKNLGLSVGEGGGPLWIRPKGAQVCERDV